MLYLLIAQFYYIYFRLFRKAKLFKLANKCYLKSESLKIIIATDDKIIAMIGDKSHKLFQEALGQEIPNNQEILKFLFKECEKRKLKNKILTWGKDTFEKFNSGVLALEEQEESEESDLPLEIDYERLSKFYEVSQSRKSIRKFQQSKIPDDVVEKILLSAIEAPSSCNRQSWRFTIFEQEKDKLFISKLRNVKFIEQTPLLICISVDSSLYNTKGEAGITSIMDASAAIMNILNAAASANLGSVWINLLASMSKEKISIFKTKYKFPATYTPIGFVAIGGVGKATNKPIRDELTKYCVHAR